MTHICVGNLTIIGSDNGLLPGRRQAITWTNVGILLIGPLWTNFSEISIKIQTFSLTKMRLKVSSAKWCPFCLGLNELTESDFTGNAQDVSYWNVFAESWFEKWIFVYSVTSHYLNQSWLDMYMCKSWLKRIIHHWHEWKLSAAILWYLTLITFATDTKQWMSFHINHAFFVPVAGCGFVSSSLLGDLLRMLELVSEPE